MIRTLSSMTRRTRKTASLLLAVFAFCLIANQASAGTRNFTYVYETTTQPKGAWEYEQWVTWKTDKDSDPEYDRIEFRHELEFGVTDKFQLGLYLSDWRYTDGASVSNDGTEWRTFAIAGIYNLTNPTTDFLGSALYGEFLFGDEKLAVEAKLLLQKKIDNWNFAYNLVYEAEWEGKDFNEEKGVFEQTFGVSYQINPSISVGFEGLHEIEYEDFTEAGDDVVYFGPNFAYRSKSNWWFTVTGLFQATSVDSEPNIQTRLLVGFDF